MQALATQIMVWAEEPEVTALRRKHFAVDLEAWARMFRNDLHNMTLLGQIEEHAALRRDGEIEELRSAVGADRRAG
jgi:type IV pilus biogenesis protein CpaD/CtpE